MNLTPSKFSRALAWIAASILTPPGTSPEEKEDVSRVLGALFETTLQTAIELLQATIQVTKNIVNNDADDTVTVTINRIHNEKISRR